MLAFWIVQLLGSQNWVAGTSDRRTFLFAELGAGILARRTLVRRTELLVIRLVELHCSQIWGAGNSARRTL